MTDTGAPARRAALGLLDAITGDGRQMSELVAQGALNQLPAEERARAMRLATETLRGLERADRLLETHLRKPPPLFVRNALRIGTVELCQGGASHGVVNAFVSIVAKSQRHARLKGLVNAVLRKIATDGPQAWPRMRPARVPDWLRVPLVEAWGGEAIARMEAVQSVPPPLDLSARTDPEAVACATGGAVLPTGSVRVAQTGQVSAMPGFAEGDWWVQDAAAALPAQILAPGSGERVLDLCAAPGGKTLQLAAMGAQVTAVDVSAARLARVEENLARTGLHAVVQTADLYELTEGFGAILLDAPCSATGTLRRHPDLAFAKDGSEFGALIEMQAQMLDHAWSLLVPGGRMVFCTCSLLPDEGEVQIEEALTRHADMRVGDIDQPWVEAGWRSSEGGLRLRPDFWADRGGMDGFYMALLHKTG